MRIIDKIARKNRKPNGSRGICIVCIGDSVTQGCFELVKDQNGKTNTRYAPGKSYVRKLQHELDRLFPVATVNVINSGLGGSNAHNSLERYADDVLRYSPDLVVHSFGLNDVLETDVERGCAEYVQSMSRMFEMAQDCGAESIYLTPNRLCSYVNANIPEGPLLSVATAAAQMQNEGVLAYYVECMKKAAANMNVPVADAYAQWETYASKGVDTTQMLANYINHPFEEYHDIFTSKIMETLFEE